MEFDLKQLEIFCKIVELGSFSNAAKSVNLAQASVSERISNLETGIGSKLLDRLGREVVPTKAGNVLYNKAIELIKLKNRMSAEMESYLECEFGNLSIEASTIPGNYILPEFISNFYKKHPKIMIEINISDSKESAENVLSGKADLGFVGSKIVNNNLVFKELWEDNLVLVIPKNHKWAKKESISYYELCKEPFISREQGSGTRIIFENCILKNFKSDLKSLNIVSILSTSTAVKEAVKKGFGISVISDRAIETEVQNNILKTLKIINLNICRKFYLIYDKRRTLSPICSIFIDFLTNFKNLK